MRSPKCVIRPPALLLATILLSIGYGGLVIPAHAQGAPQNPPTSGASTAALSENTRGSDARGIADSRIRGRVVNLMDARRRANNSAATAAPIPLSSGTASAIPSPQPLSIQTQTAAPVAPNGTRTLPLWTYKVHSSRDGNHYPGVMVGGDPFKNPGTTKVPTFVVPLILETQTVVLSVDPTTGAILSTQPGVTRFDPTVADPVCLAAPNDIPTKLVKESPVFTAITFNFGGTVVGTTQYADAFQRASFWNAPGVDIADKYHVLLDPVRFIDPIVVHVPAIYGLAFTNGLVFGPPAFCAPLAFVDYQWFDTYLKSTLIPALAQKGVNPATFPIFLSYNTLLSFSSASVNVFPFAYQNLTGFPIPTQTYAAASFDSTGVLPVFGDIAPLAIAVAEWMDDPMLTVAAASNPTPFFPLSPVSCYAFLLPDAPLSGVDMPPVVMPNSFSYTLPELASFSWFFGAPSIGVNGWFSNNGTFLSDAGPPCQE